MFLQRCKRLLVLSILAITLVACSSDSGDTGDQTGSAKQITEQQAAAQPRIQRTELIDEAKLDDELPLPASVAIGKSKLEKLLDNAIETGELDLSTLSQQEIALLSIMIDERLRLFNNQAAAEEFSHVELMSLSREAAPQPLPCPAADAVPSQWQNELNRQMLQQQDCNI